MSTRFDPLWSLFRFSRQKQPRLEGTNMKEWEWELVNYHIEHFNRHRLEILSPSDRLCVDEFFSRWYVLVGYCINLAPSHYLQMDRNPYAG